MNEFVYHTNRGSAIFDAALVPLGGRKLQPADTHVDLLYFDSYGGKSPPVDVTCGFQLINRQRTTVLDNKSKMAAILKTAGINNPRVYFDPATVPDEPDTLWFVKNPMLSGGKGIAVVRHRDIMLHFKPGYIIQEAVQDLLLIKDRKFTLRAYVLVTRGDLYLFPRAISVLHGAPYNHHSQDAMVQFQHVGYMDAKSPITMAPFEIEGQQEQVLISLSKLMQQTFAAFRDLLKHEPPDTYCVFGVDVLVKSDLNTVLIEINDRPNLVHPAVVNEAVNVPMLRALYCVLAPDRRRFLANGSPQFEKIAAL